MGLTFVSNYINHHQIPFSNACYKRLGEEYAFVQTSRMEAERIQMGWRQEGEALPYVHCFDEEEAACRALILESDVLLAGWTDREDLICERLEAGKLTIRVSERLYREGQWKAVSPRGLVRKYQEHTRFRNNPVYLLCAGAYVPSDFHLIGAYPGKMFRWGYFPETISYDQETWEQLKEKDGSIQIVWAGRFIPLKHPEYMVQLAGDLRKEGFSFHIHMAGGGELEAELRQQCREQELEEYFSFYGFCSPEQVRKIMEGCHIHVFTSDHLEGWGAVVNEAMNSGCAEVVNVQVGAAPFLIRHGENGLLYRDGRYDSMLEAVRFLIEHPAEREKMGRKAYETITGLWNAEAAAAELLRFITGLQEGKVLPAQAGPLSVAPVIAPGRMYRYLTGRRNGIESGK